MQNTSFFYFLQNIIDANFNTYSIVYSRKFIFSCNTPIKIVGYKYNFTKKRLPTHSITMLNMNYVGQVVTEEGFTINNFMKGIYHGKKNW